MLPPFYFHSDLNCRDYEIGSGVVDQDLDTGLNDANFVGLKILLRLFLKKNKAQLALIMRAVRSVGFLRRRRVSRGEFGVLE